MSYRTFKRVLGETSLERKCRWWFGMSLVVLLTLSFTWYGRQTDKLVDEQHQDARARSSCAPAGRSCTSKSWPTIEEQDAGAKRSTDLYRELAESSQRLGREFQWDAILAAAPTARSRRSPEDYRAARRIERQAGWPSGRRPPQPPATCRRRSESAAARGNCRTRRIARIEDRRQPASISTTSRCTPSEVVRQLPSSALGRVAESELARRRLDGRGPRDDRRPGRPSTHVAKNRALACGRRRSSSGSCRCFRCGPWCGT